MSRDKRCNQMNSHGNHDKAHRQGKTSNLHEPRKNHFFKPKPVPEPAPVIEPVVQLAFTLGLMGTNLG